MIDFEDIDADMATRVLNKKIDVKCCKCCPWIQNDFGRVDNQLIDTVVVTTGSRTQHDVMTLSPGSHNSSPNSSFPCQELKQILQFHHSLHQM